MNGLSPTRQTGHYFLMLRKFIWLWIARAADNSVMLTDKLTVLVVPFSTLVIRMSGAKMTETVQETLALGVAASVIAVVILRIMAAPYWIWRDDQAERQRLQAELDRPDRQTEASMKEYAIDVRKRLSEKLAQLVAVVHFSSMTHTLSGGNDRLAEELYELDRSIISLSTELSYDMPARVAAINLRDSCLEVIRNKLDVNNGGHDSEKLWQQRKLTFRILHKEHSINELITLMELEIMLDDAGKTMFSTEHHRSTVNSADGSVSALKDQLRSLGEDLHKREVIDTLRRQLRSTDAGQ